MSLVKFRLGLALAHYVWCPYKKGRFGHKDKQEEHHVKKAEISVMLCKPRNAREPANHQKLGSRHGTDSFLHPSEEFNPDDLISDFSLQNCETINFCFKPCSLRYFAVAALES